VNSLIALLAERALALGIAVTVVLGCAALAVTVSGNPLFRQRAAELGIAGATLSFLLLLLPLPGPIGQLSLSLHKKAESVSVREQESLPSAVVYLNAPFLEPAPISSMDYTNSFATAKVMSAPSTMKEPQKLVSLQDAVAMVFVWGFLAMASYLAFCALLLAYLSRRTSPLPAWLVEVLPESSTARIALCKRSPRPFCFGLMKAHIILPASLARRKNVSLLRCVVQHELAHVELGHIRFRQIIAACSTFLFAHPLYWWLARQQREAAELLADDCAAAKVGKPCYVEQLISLVEQLRSTGRKNSLSAYLQLPVLGAPQKADGPFYQRMKTLLMRPTTLSTRLTRLQVFTRGLASISLLTFVVLALGRPVIAQEVSKSVESEAQPRIFRMAVDMSAEGVGLWLCRLADNGVQISDLQIGNINNEGLRHVTFNLVPITSVPSHESVKKEVPKKRVFSYDLARDGTLSMDLKQDFGWRELVMLQNLHRNFWKTPVLPGSVLTPSTSSTAPVDDSALNEQPKPHNQDLENALKSLNGPQNPHNQDLENALKSLNEPPNPHNQDLEGARNLWIKQANPHPSDLEKTLPSLFLKLQNSNMELRTIVAELQQNVADLNKRIEGEGEAH